jgi:hypothetical protein
MMITDDVSDQFPPESTMEASRVGPHSPDTSEEQVQSHPGVELFRMHRTYTPASFPFSQAKDVLASPFRRH